MIWNSIRNFLGHHTSSVDRSARSRRLSVECLEARNMLTTWTGLDIDDPDNFNVAENWDDGVPTTEKLV